TFINGVIHVGKAKRQGGPGVGKQLGAVLNVLISFEKVQLLPCLLDSVIGVNVYTHTPLLGSLLCGDNNYPVGGPGTINGGGCRIFQNINRFNIPGIETVEPGGGKSIH